MKRVSKGGVGKREEEGEHKEGGRSPWKGGQERIES